MSSSHQNCCVHHVADMDWRGSCGAGSLAVSSDSLGALGLYNFEALYDFLPSEWTWVTGCFTTG